jgi:hypothetical protein
MASGVNGNQGAESTVSFLLALLAIVESYATADRAQDEGGSASSEAVGANPQDMPKVGR